MRILLVLVGGGLGSVVRYLVSVALTERLGNGFPGGTVAVNLIGSFLIGLVATLADERGALSAQTRLFLVAGVLGGFTTFSAFSLETLRLLEGGHPGRAVLNVLGSVLPALAAVWLGTLAGRGLPRWT